MLRALRTVAHIVCILAYETLAAAQPVPIDNATSVQYFDELRAACEKDGGKLWGVPLRGPVLFVDPATRKVVANQSDLQGQLVSQEGVFTGRLPDSQPVANFATTWAGVKWTMLVWPFLPSDPVQRLKLMLHESFHRVQNDLKFPASNTVNDHLDTKDGRLWLQLEWRALRQAITSGGDVRRRAIEDALAFRDFRRSLFPKSDESERALEMNEGLAEYTGVKLCLSSNVERANLLASQIEQAPRRPTFVRSFAYVTGPAYGVLLDESDPNWRKQLTPTSDLGNLLQKSRGIRRVATSRAAVQKRSASYGGEALVAAETEREGLRKKRLAEFRVRLVDGPTLVLPMTTKGSLTFDPNNLIPMDDASTVYPTAKVIDEWGILEVSDGSLMTRENGGVTKISVCAPGDITSIPVTGAGWTLQLQPGWELVPADRQGSYLLKKQGQN